jgi:hypothetical protein
MTGALLRNGQVNGTIVAGEDPLQVPANQGVANQRPAQLGQAPAYRLMAQEQGADAYSPSTGMEQPLVVETIGSELFDVVAVTG